MSDNHKTLNLAIVDDHPIYASGLAKMITDDSDHKVVFIANDGLELKDKLLETQPDIILLDVVMPNMNGIDATKHIKTHYPEIKIIILTSSDEEDFIVYLTGLGVNGYLLKNAGLEEVLQACHAVSNGAYYFPSFVTEIMTKHLHNSDDENQEGDNSMFTPEEIKIIRLLSYGKTTKDIAKEVFVSPRTLERHRHQMMAKANVKNIAGLISYAFRNNLLE